MPTPEKLNYALSLTGKYVKKALTQLEEYLEVERLDPQMRKILLDAFEDMKREQAKVLGAEVQK